jgi:hypothetical protein
MVRDEELLCLLRDANFVSVFIGIESPRKASLVETHKTQNEKLDLVEAVHKIQAHNLFISAGMIVGFDHDDAEIFNEQYAFLQEAQIPIVMLSTLLAVPRTPLYERLEAQGRLRTARSAGADLTRYVGTDGGANFVPLNMTIEELRTGQQKLYQRLYAPAAFGDRLLGNLGRFRDVHYRPEPLGWQNLLTFFRLVRLYWRQGGTARKFFWKTLWRTVRHSPRSLSQMVILLGMYEHFRTVHADTLAWNPWAPEAVTSVNGANGVKSAHGSAAAVEIAKSRRDREAALSGPRQ